MARDRESTDPVTGLPNRETLLAAIEREWELSKRGTVESYVVVCHLRDRDAISERYGEAMANLLLKDVAEVLGGAIRRTDYLARVSRDGLTAVLVGCKGPDGALAFLGRFERALERVTAGRRRQLQLSYGIQRLADADSPQRGARARRDLGAAPRPQGATARRSAPARQGERMSTDPLMGRRSPGREAARPSRARASPRPGSAARAGASCATSSWSSAS